MQCAFPAQNGWNVQKIAPDFLDCFALRVRTGHSRDAAHEQAGLPIAFNDGIQDHRVENTLVPIISYVKRVRFSGEGPYSSAALVVAMIPPPRHTSPS